VGCMDRGVEDLGWACVLVKYLDSGGGVYGCCVSVFCVGLGVGGVVYRLKAKVYGIVSLGPGSVHWNEVKGQVGWNLSRQCSGKTRMIAVIQCHHT